MVSKALAALAGRILPVFSLETVGKSLDILAPRMSGSRTFRFHGIGSPSESPATAGRHFQEGLGDVRSKRT